MSFSPINPQDHRVRDLDPEAYTAEHGRPGERINLAGTDALAEAIHQTFERDAADDERFVEYCRACAVANEPEQSYSTWWALNATADPDTEIDRMARLIVQGEYRRRHESEEKA